MSSPPEEQHYHGHLDATTGREVVYCHACSNEWHRDTHGLVCPQCHSDVTEIISPENDPRELDDRQTPSTASSTRFPFSHEYPTGDSDPEEADIEEHTGPHGFHYHRNTTQTGPGQNHHDPSIDNVFRQFVSMLNTLGPAQGAGGAVPVPPDGSGSGPGPGSGSFSQGGVHRQTYHSTFGRNGTASVTIVSGPATIIGGQSMGSANSPRQAGGGDPFQSVFQNLMSDVGPGRSEDGQMPRPMPTNFARGLQEILGMFNPAMAVSGDAVYSQEALDQIISDLMEANPQSNAAPPASNEALSKLEKRQITPEMLAKEGKTDCSICLDDLEEGQTAAFLPCKHWFHELCVVEWLKAHNTCPVCRTPIEKREPPSHRGNSGTGGGNGTNNPESENNNHHHNGGGPGMPLLFQQPPAPQQGGRGGVWSFGAPDSQGQNQGGNQHRVIYARGPFVFHTRPPMPTHSHGRLNEAMRSLSYAQQRHREEMDAERTGRSASPSVATGFNYDTSRLQRRSSMSPTSPRATAFDTQSSRHRQRSPHAEDRRPAIQQRRASQGGQGPISWLRDRFMSRRDP